MIFDEAQRLPELFSYIQNIVDESGKMGQFILSGSQNFQLLENITQSLAGRVALLKLFPFDFTEMKSAGLLSESFEDSLVRGFYPAMFSRDLDSSRFYTDYIQTYVERDIVNIVNVRDLKQFRMFLRLCAGRVGQLINMNSLANECGISQPTAKSWLNILEASYIIFQLTPFHKNFNKRVVKTPKLYFYDTGLACHLLNIKKGDDLKLHPYKGNLFENLIIAELQKQSDHNSLNKEFYFWRDSNGHEIDLVSMVGLAFDIYEIKSSRTILSDQFSGLRYFKELAKDEVLSSTLYYAGNETHNRTGYHIKPWNQTEFI